MEYDPAPDADGSYYDAAAVLADEFGITLNHDYGALDQYCDPGDPTRDTTTTIPASFCSATPSQIWINPDYAGFTADYYTEWFVDTVRHEIAHEQIFQICGTTRPVAAGSLVEGVTNSYAVQYLGADFALLQPDDPGSDYFMTGETDEIADQIHSGQFG